MMRLLRSSRYLMAKKSMSDAFKHFLEHDAYASVRREPHQKDRKYANVEVVEEFKREEEIRKRQRLEHVKARKKLLEQKISIESKLLTSQESQELKDVNQEITTLQTLLEAQQKQLANIEAKLQETEADLILVEGHRKIVVLNKITYLKHLNYHPTGLVLHPEVMKMIENIHYLVNNNLPVNKYKLFEVMPELFETQVNELEESMQRLIEEKKLDPDSETSSRIRFFMRHKARFRDPEQDIIDLQQKRDNIFENMETEIVNMIEPHMDYIRLVDAGQTPFRNTEHMIHVMLSDNLNLKFTPEEEALKKSIEDVVKLKQDFAIYSDEVNEQVLKMRHKYVEPPVWIKNHPVLMERYEKIMVKWMNPTPVQDVLPDFTPRDGGRAYLEEKLRAITQEKYHPLIEKLWNEGRKDELVAKKKELEIDFYNQATNIHEEYLEMLAENQEKEEFLKIPKKPRELSQQKHASLTLDDLTKSIMVNNSNPAKYNLEFFTQYLGLQSVEETRKLFNSFSFMRIPEQPEKAPEDLKFEIMKFKG